MKHIFTLLFAVLAFAACTQNDVEELTANRADVPETLTVGFEGGDDTRIQLNEAQKTVWNAGDEVSVFYKSYDNLKFQFQGKTGDRSGTLKMVDGEVGAQTMGRVVVAYPYSTSYRVSDGYSGIEAILPATQTYFNGSYGIGDNLMVSQSEFTQFSLKSVCGWLKIQLTGNGERVQSLTLRGNNEEQLAGLIYVDTATAESTLASEMGSADDNNAGGNLVFDDAIVTELTLDCGEGVELGAEATAFYIAVPPQTFEQGIAVEILCDGYKPMTLTTTSELVIERNHIKPMEAIELDADAIKDTIYYTATAKVEADSYYPWTFDTFGANIVSHEWDSESSEGVITFDADVTTIGDSAFHNCDSLTSVTIPDSVTTIGAAAFGGCDRLTSITIPDSVTTIEFYAFRYCSNLTSVTIGDSVTTIGYYAFYNCDRLTSVTIPDSVTTIGEYAFYNCDSLTSVTIGDSVTTIGSSAFCDCDSLTSVTIGDSVTTIGSSAFRYCDSLASVYISDIAAWCNINFVSYYENPLCYGANLYLNNELVTDLTIPDSVTTIGEYAFYNCDSLTSVTIGDSVTAIGDWAFDYCDSLTSVTIGDSVTTIGNLAFLNCDSLAEFNGKFASEDGRCLIIDGVLNNVAPAGLTSYTIPDSVTTIGKRAFDDCDSLTSVTIGDSVTTIGSSAFRYCDSLTSVTIPDSVTTIGSGAFWGCGSLRSITIFDSVTTIGSGAFYGCSSLTSVYCEATTPPSLDGSYVFDDNASGRTIYVPEESVQQYKIAEDWSKYADAIVGFDFSITSIINYTASDDQIINACLPIISNTYSNGIGTIEFLGSIIPVEAFDDCDSLTSVTIGDSVTTIGEGAFADCANLVEFNGKFASEDGRCLIVDGTLNSFAIGCGATEYTIPDSVTTIGYFAFYDCYSLTSITIPDSVTTIGDSAFRYCHRLSIVYCEATTPPSLGGSDVFDGNALGRTIYVPEESVRQYKIAEGWSEYDDAIVGIDFSTTSIINYTTSDDQIINANLSIISNTYSNGIGTIEFLGSIMPGRAFYNCDSLTSVTIPDSVTTIGSSAFDDCDSLTSITIPDSVTTIGDCAFTTCSSLTSVTIGDSVTTIGYFAFCDCYSLKSVYCEATTPPSLGSAVFDCNASGRKIYVPTASVGAYKSSAGWSEYADAIVGYDFENGVVVE